MEEQYFNALRTLFVSSDSKIEAGKMMSSEAIQYQGKVFAFFSRKKKMVFKLGKAYDPDEESFEINVFNPFKKRAPLYGWFEVPYEYHEVWQFMTEKALSQLKKELA